jgi:hypothetical protein
LGKEYRSRQLIYSRRKCGISIFPMFEKPDRYGKTKK